MTAEKFKNWLCGLDAKMRISKRQILLLTDNCPAHPKDLYFLTNIKVEFLPPNTTSHTQPLDMGIIKVLKHRYRQKLVRRLIAQMTRGEPLTRKDFKINIVQAMHCIVAGWNEVTKETIQNCFRKAGLLPPGEAPLQKAELAVDAEEEEDAAIDMDAALDAPPGAYSKVTERWEDVLQVFEETGMSFEQYVTADDFTPVCEVQDIQDIIATLRKETEKNEEDVDGEWESGSDGENEGEDGQPARLISKAEAMGALERFRQYLSQLNAPADEVEDLVTLTSKLENTTLGLSSRNLKQGTLDMLFKKH
ncbi:tigger transposable element-derived protein 6-like [Frankliniella occidentalis]|uniref:Tigger transposable element-derived protein 6-like n=1 Tax=Frankliniella occidentalis TaxID=133901 RepID=A0A9C6X713_FRAOC|nr:tigger transposable element-derived protein 6-like [Frankliniella occidentalis]